MPKGPAGQKRPGNVIGTAIMVAKIATEEVEDRGQDPQTELHRQGGMVGGRHRAQKLTPERRQEIAKRAAQARWKKVV